jgi:DNA modification methylase
VICPSRASCSSSEWSVEPCSPFSRASSGARHADSSTRAAAPSAHSYALVARGAALGAGRAAAVRGAIGPAAVVVKIHTGDALSVLRTLESESVQCVVTSPPYFQLRDYGVRNQMGLENTPAEFIAKLIAVFDEVKRVCRNDATVWVNLRDSYAGSGKGPTGHNGIGDQEQRQGFTGVSSKSTLNGYTAGSQLRQPILGGGASVAGIAAKNLLLIPERFAIAMQDAGWYVRSRIAWCKTSAMPESVRDRPTSAWEHVWLFTKSRTYHYDQAAVAQPSVSTHGSGNGYARPERLSVGGRGQDEPWQVQPLSQLRNYWVLGPEPSSLEHYAAYPTELVKRCILAGTSQRGCCPACRAPWVRVVERQAVNPDGLPIRRQDVIKTDGDFRKAKGTPGEGWYHLGSIDTTTTGWRPGCTCDAGEPVPCVVLDCFGGSGTTGLVASRLGRDAVLIELSPAYAEMARQRIYGDAPLFADIEVAG